jgi:hypothetical protein
MGAAGAIGTAMAAMAMAKAGVFKTRRIRQVGLYVFMECCI